MIYAIIAAAIGVVALCLHYSTRSYGPPSKSFVHEDMWDGRMDLGGGISDGSDGSIPGDPWGTTYDYLDNED
jgi:hypothetical protein